MSGLREEETEVERKARRKPLESMGSQREGQAQAGGSPTRTPVDERGRREERNGKEGLATV